MKLQGSTDFTISSRLNPEELRHELERIVKRFVADKQAVLKSVVLPDGDRSFRVELLIAADSFAQGDDLMMQLAEYLHSQFAETRQSDDLLERMTELVPA